MHSECKSRVAYQKMKRGAHRVARQPELKYFTFRQNNSGGSISDNANVAAYVIVEARDAAEANDIAESKGVYFDGCEAGIDCDCCGDRWYPAHETDGTVVPTVYGEPIVFGAPRADEPFEPNMLRDGVVIHHHDGERYKIGEKRE